MSKEMQLLTWSCGHKLVSLGVGKKKPGRLCTISNYFLTLRGTTFL